VLVILQVASTAATARLIAPAEFGAYATAQAAAGIFGYFTLAAIGQDILRRHELGPRTVGTGVAMSLLGAIAVAGVMWLVATVWANLWHVSGAASLVRAFAVTLFLVSCSTVPLALLRRRLRFAAAAISETGSQVLGVTAGVLLAIHMHSAMALAVGQALAAASLLTAAVLLTRRELAFGFSISEARKLFSFAGQVSLLNAGFFSLYTAPSWVIARLFGAHTLGLYSRANVIVGLPSNYLTTGLTKVMYPLYGRVGKNAKQMKDLLSEAVVVATGFVWPFLAIVAGASPIVVRLLLGSNWGGTAMLLRLCVLIACANVPWVLLTTAAEALGWMRLVWVRQASYLAVLIAGVAFVRLEAHGVDELLMGVAAAQWAAYALTLSAFVRRKYLDTRLTISSHCVHGAAALGAYASAAGCARLLHSKPVGVQLAGEILVTLAVGAALFGGRLRFPATRVLGQRLVHANPEKGARFLIRLGFTPSP
jgi:O-antigen/teichoic acid export membrane protein